MRLRNRNDVFSYQGYIAHVDPKERPFKEIAASYDVEPAIQCGLCGQWHNSGYVVTLLDGGATNVGHICGKRFGAQFEKARLQYLEDIVRPRLIAKLSRCRAEIASAREVALLCDRARVAARSKAGLLFKYPHLKSELGRRANDNVAKVSRPVPRSEAEIDDLVAMSPGRSRENFRFKEVVVGSLQGLDYFKPDSEARIFEIDATLQRLPDVRFNGESTEALLAWERFFDGFDEAVGLERTRVEAGERFMRNDNLRLLAEVPASAAVRAELAEVTASELEFFPSRRAAANDGEVKQMNRRQRRAAAFARR